MADDVLRLIGAGRAPAPAGDPKGHYAWRCDGPRRPRQLGITGGRRAAVALVRGATTGSGPVTVGASGTTPRDGGALVER